MSEQLCSCCQRKVPLDLGEFVNPTHKYGPGLCDLCKTFSPVLREAIAFIKWNINLNWLNEHKDDIYKALFSWPGTGQVEEEPASKPEGGKINATNLADHPGSSAG